jgi:hypothetical protein
MTDSSWGMVSRAQAGLDTVLDLAALENRAPSVCLFMGDRTRVMPGRFNTGELKIGDPFAFKFFRGVAVYGIGQIHVRVFVNKAPVNIYRPLDAPDYGTPTTHGTIEMAETPDPQRVLWLPRGTKGRTLSIEGSGDFSRIRGIVVFWDPLIGDEDG